MVVAQKKRVHAITTLGYAPKSSSSRDGVYSRDTTEFVPMELLRLVINNDIVERHAHNDMEVGE